MIALGLLSAQRARAQVFSPGKLARAHAAFEAKCESCHVKAKAGKVEPRRCLSCHRVLDVRIKAHKGLHGREQLMKCARCHMEHLGRGHALVKWTPRSFNHIRTGYPLRGKHAKLTCRKCHLPAKQRGAVTRLFGAARRKRTYLGLRRGCVTCHKDPHKGALGTACASCHGDQGFKPVTRFTAHNRTRFPLRGKHRKLGCERCHRPAGPSSPMKFAGVLHDSCIRCHKSPHRRMGQQRRPKIPCRNCHGEDSFRHITFTKANHPRTLPLRGGHARTACKSCHGKKAESKPRGTRCVSCHRDPHKRRFGLTCQKCHTPFGWWTRRGKLMSLGKVKLDQVKRAATIGIGKKQVQAVAFHNKTRFSLDGQHVTLPCKKCHGRRGRGRRRFRKLRNMRFGRCQDCHKDPHQGVLATRRSGSKRRCEDCHETRGWALTSFGLERHQKTRFPLEGAHQVVACAACHPRKTRSAKRRFHPPSARCESCHKDKHRGRYRLTAGSAPLPCQTCHQTKSFRQLAFDHQKTKFPLHGKHAQTACKSCHRPTASRGITAFRGLSQRCESCHADTRHGGQFLARGKVRGCGDCHDTKSFKIERFAHRAKTGVSLAGGHRRVKCAGCHIKVTSPAATGPRQVVLYRLGKAGCQSCHATYHKTVGQRAWKRLAPHARGALLAQTLGSKPAATSLQRCGACHRVKAWRAIKRKVRRFDHASVGYALRARHAQATCNRCHNPQRKRISRRCASCHRDPHAGKLGTRCSECHDSRSWRPSALLARHRRTRLPLTGFHALADCASCHPRNAKPLFRGAPAACVACHASRYDDPKTHPNHRTAGFDQRCERCHRPTGWRGARFNSQTAALTAHRRLPLTGGHAKLACTSCHGTKRPRPDCASCHYKRARRVRQPDHRFAPLDRRCGRCHGTTSWKKARLGAKHAGFPLNGKHARLTCNDCHREGNGFRAFSCTGACHDPRKLRPGHRRVRGFVAESRACKRCHPLGRR